jgi:excisionase family DNA binding protein
MRKLVRLANAAEHLGLRKPTLREWYAKRKNLDFVKVGRAVCVTEESLDRFITENVRPCISSAKQSQLQEPRTRSGLQVLAREPQSRRCRTQRPTAPVAFSQGQL